MFRYKIVKLYSNQSYSIKLSSPRIKIISPFTVHKGNCNGNKICDSIFEKYFIMLSFIDENTIVAIMEEVHEEIIVNAYLNYKSFLLFENDEVYDLTDLNSEASKINTQRAIKNWENDREFYQTIQSIINEFNITALSHGGYIRVAEISENTIHIKLEGQCIGCRFSISKLSYSIRDELEKKIGKKFSITVVPTSSSS